MSYMDASLEVEPSDYSNSLGERKQDLIKQEPQE